MDPGDVSRAGYGGYKTLRLAGRILNQRKWLWHLRYQAVAKALQRDDEGVITASTGQAAEIMCEALSNTEIPMEQASGWARKTNRWVRESITQGVRYPECRGPMRTTFWQRLYMWARRAAETRAGAEALAFCGFEEEDRSHIFASRFIAETYVALLDSGLPNAMNTVRHEMAEQILHGHSDEEREARRRRLRALITSVSTSATSSVVTFFGFDTTIYDSVAIGSVTLVATAAVDIAHSNMAGLGQKSAAARRQVRNWLMTLSAWMVGYVTWGESQLRAGEYTGVDQLIYVLKVMTERGVELAPVPRDEQIFEDLQHLMDIAARAPDSRLEAGLMEVQGALMYRREAIPVAIGNLISVVQDVPDIPEPTPKPAVSGNRPPLQLSFTHPDGDST